MNPQYQNQVRSSPNPMIGIVVLTLGIAGLCMLLPMLLVPLCGIVPFVFGVAATVLGILGFSRVRRDPSNYGGKILSITATIFGVLCILVPILWTAIVMGLYLYLGMEKPSGRFY